MYCYYFRVLQQYNASMDFAVEVPPGYAHVRQPAPGANLRCKCRKRKDREKKSQHPAPRAEHIPDGGGSGHRDPDSQWSGPSVARSSLAPGVATEL